VSGPTGRAGATPPDLTRVRPYGDTLDDGVVQLSFSLPVPFGEEAREAARQMVAAMGMVDPQVYSARDLGEGYSFFIVYARCLASIDYTAISVPRIEGATMSKKEVEAYVAQHAGRRIVMLGATTGTDAHTVGIDAIMNIKGYAGEKGLEAYAGFEAINLGAQVANEDLVARAVALNADALLVSQVVTQKDSHRITLGKLIDMLEAEGLRERMVVVCGGPRIGHELALELGYDAGFGPGTLAPEVATFVARQVVQRGLAGGG
jgi:beta-lysine 5,6-aminomutase beta subunit